MIALTYRSHHETERVRHWFDGDGFAQRWEVRDGKVSHRGRFVATQKFTDESQTGQFLYPAFGTLVKRSDIKISSSARAT